MRRGQIVRYVIIGIMICAVLALLIGLAEMSKRQSDETLERTKWVETYEGR